jgi:hypothetical protein
MKSLLLFAAIAIGAYMYVDSNGGSAGAPPFTPMFYWKYSGEASYPLTVRSNGHYAKLVLSGALKEGQIELSVLRDGRPIGPVKVLTGTFSDTTRYPKIGGNYQFIFKAVSVKGYLRHDLVSTADIY